MVPPPTLTQNIGRLAIGSLFRLAPPLGARLAWSHFVKSPKPVSSDAQDEHFLQTHARQETLQSAGHRVRVYHLESPGEIRMRVLMMHGWGSRATALLGIGKQFMRAGADVVLYDGPGSGLTESPMAILPHGWQVLEDLQRTAGPFDVVVGHSFAGLTAAPVLAAGKLPTCRVFVTVGSPNSLETMTERVLRDRGMPGSVMSFFDKRSLELSGKPMSELGIVAAMCNMSESPLRYLCLHDYEDKEVSVTHADEIERALPWVQVERTSGLGHNRILRDVALQERIREFADEVLYS